MEEVYQIKRNSIVELLNQIDEFKDKIDSFIEDHDDYNYDLEINKLVENNETKWIAKLVVIKDE